MLTLTQLKCKAQHEMFQDPNIFMLMSTALGRHTRSETPFPKGKQRMEGSRMLWILYPAVLWSLLRDSGSLSQQNQQGLVKPPEKSLSATLAELWREQTSSTESSLVPWLRERHRRAMGNRTGEKLKETLKTSPATSIKSRSDLSGEAAQDHKTHGQVKG